MDKSSDILEEIKKAKSILLHCHPSPDPDSVGSVLAMKFAIEQIGEKRVTIIKGDSNIPKSFMHFPGADDIVQKNFTELDLNDFDLFIILDSGSEGQISSIKTPKFPLPIRSIAIDHHITNDSFADINLIDTSSPATAFTLFRLFKEWGIEINHNIATNLFMGMYTDTGGFKYSLTDYKVLKVASELAEIAKDFTKTIFIMENSQTKESIYFQALALSSIKTFLDENIAIASVSNRDIKEKNIPEECMGGVSIPNILKSVIGWNIGIFIIEEDLNKIKISIRTRDYDRFDVSKLAKALGGGGHRAAGGARLQMSLDEAIQKVVETAKMIYNL